MHPFSESDSPLPLFRDSAGAGSPRRVGALCARSTPLRLCESSGSLERARSGAAVGERKAQCCNSVSVYPELSKKTSNWSIAHRIAVVI